jgi:hypothetical protein
MTLPRSWSATSDPRVGNTTNRNPTPLSISNSEATTQNEIMELVDRVEVLANETGSLRTELEERPLIYTVQIRDLNDIAYRLVEPILIVLEKYQFEDNVVASYPEVEVFGEGATESEAILNLKFALLDLFDELNSLAFDEFGDLPKSWINILNRLIQKIE